METIEVAAIRNEVRPLLLEDLPDCPVGPLGVLDPTVGIVTTNELIVAVLLGLTATPCRGDGHGARRGGLAGA